MNTMKPDILFVDLSERELQARQQHREKLRRLMIIEQTRDKSGGLSDEQYRELFATKQSLLNEKAIDPFFREVLAAYNQITPEDIKSNTPYQHIHGFFGSQQFIPGDPASENEQELAAICGLLQLDNMAASYNTGNFVRKVVEAQGEYRQSKKLFEAVFSQLSDRFRVPIKSQIARKVLDGEVTQNEIKVATLSEAGQPAVETAKRKMVRHPEEMVYAISAKTIAAVVRRLVNDRVSPNDPWISSNIDNAFDTQTGVVNGAAPSSLEISLPDLEEPVDVDIVEANLHAIQAIYFSYMLEEMRLFQVVDRIVELFRQGMLPLGRGKAGDYLFRYFKNASERITEGERRDLYMRAFGAPGGDPNGPMPNREFNELWLRFVSAVSNFARQLTVEKMLRNAVPMAISQEQVRKAARDLAANLSLHGYGIAYFAATELQQTIVEFRDLLQDQEVRTAFGARDMWQVIDQVNANYLGGPKNSQRYRTQARSGAVIIRWLAKNGRRMSSGYGTDVISIDAITNPQLRALGSDQPITNPTDWDLLQACEQWLAVGGVQDQSIEHYSQPIESPLTTSKPISGGIPQAARDVLDGMGISLPGV
jgi:hypothetical protein